MKSNLQIIADDIIADNISFNRDNMNIIHKIDHMDENSIYHYILNRSNHDINYFWLGQRNYNKIWELQKNIQEDIKKNSLSDVILFLEHNPVYTLGKNADESNLLPTKPTDMPIIKTDRGGDITYHGPGQLIGYPIVDLKHYHKSITWFMRGLEDSIIKMLNSINIKSDTKEGLTGVWVQDKKIAALGVRLSKWVSMHGFAINVSTDMKQFNGIVPCGISNFGLTSILKSISKEYTLLDIALKMTVPLSEMFKQQKRNGKNHA